MGGIQVALRKGDARPPPDKTSRALSIAPRLIRFDFRFASLFTLLRFHSASFMTSTLGQHIPGEEIAKGKEGDTSPVVGVLAARRCCTRPVIKEGL